jgi:hypothetical protein
MFEKHGIDDKLLRSLFNDPVSTAQVSLRRMRWKSHHD